MSTPEEEVQRKRIQHIQDSSSFEENTRVSRLLPKCRVWAPDFAGTISCLASLPLNSREVGLYFSSSNSRKSQGCSGVCFPCEVPSILCFHTDTKSHVCSGTQEGPTRSWLWHTSLRGSLRVLSWQVLQCTKLFVIANSDIKYSWRELLIHCYKEVAEAFCFVSWTC